jgi:hypothetical protein
MMNRREAETQSQGTELGLISRGGPIRSQWMRTSNLGANLDTFSFAVSAPLRLCVKGSRFEESWLPDMDLNHDKVIQSHLCYRYTIGQDGAREGNEFRW